LRIIDYKPKTKKECFAQLDEMLSETDKKAIVEAEDLLSFILPSVYGFATIGYTTAVKKNWNHSVRHLA